MNVFIDTNTFLNFFDFSKEDLTELRKIAVLIDNGKIRLILTQQVEDEFLRNRENKIDKALKDFSAGDFNVFPQMLKSYPEYDDLVKAKRAYNTAKRQLLDRIESEKVQSCLTADNVIDQIFGSSECIPVVREIVDRAVERSRRGNPPGKKGETVGDQINWEILLAEFKVVPVSRTDDLVDKDLHIISADPDWSSDFDREKPKPFLMDEWNQQTNGQLFLYTRISSFTDKYFPEIDLAAEREKDELVQALVKSGNFSWTHGALYQLDGISEFSRSHVETILNAYCTNQQITLIILDADVLAFLMKLVTKYPSWVTSASAKTLLKILESCSTNDADKAAKVDELKARLGERASPFWSAPKF